MTTSKTLAARLATIMGEVGRIEKKGKITSQGSGPSYKFARDTDVLDAVTPKMAEAGIVIVPEHVELLSMEPTLSGKQLIANIKTAWHCTDGAESIRFETFGQGADSGDKALPKAQSNARKYAFFMLYHIVTGDDPDHWASDEGRSRAPAQARQGERAREAESSPAGTPASSQTYTNRGQIQQAIVEAAKERGLGIAAIDAKAQELGIARGEATMEQLLVLLVAIERGEPEKEAAEVAA